jgi:hypothetical protein
MHALKVTKKIVQILSLVVTLSFALNSINGFLGAVDLADGGIQTDAIDPGDFKIDNTDLFLEIGMKINNTGVYDLTGIKIRMTMEVTNNITNIWTTILNASNTQVNGSEAGEIIKSGEVKNIGLKAEKSSFAKSPEEIATLLMVGDPTSWSLEDVLALQNIKFEARITLQFEIAYAYGQFQLDFEVILNTEAIQGGL